MSCTELHVDFHVCINIRLVLCCVVVSCFRAMEVLIDINYVVLLGDNSDSVV